MTMIGHPDRLVDPSHLDNDIFYLDRIATIIVMEAQ